MLWMLSKRVCLSSQCSGQYRKKWFMDSISPPQIQMGFIAPLKPYLNLYVHWDGLNQEAIWLIPLYHMGYKYQKYY